MKVVVEGDQSKEVEVLSGLPLPLWDGGGRG
jgi:hypothetical protein